MKENKSLFNFDGILDPKIMQEMEKFLNQKKEFQEDSISKFRDKNFLPTREEITKSFTHAEWYDFCFNEENPVFEFLNEEYLEAFSDYLVGKIKEYNKNEEKPLIVLEIGAGNGRLTHFLQEKIDKKASNKVKVIATDSGDWALNSDFPVEQLKHDEAINKYNPDIVIFSWMPYEEDSTKDIRKFDNVKEYILIGEKDGGCCGHPWETWGESWGISEDDDNDNQIPPYEKDGFEKEVLDDLSSLQICRTDFPGDYYHSSTVSFKRKK